MQNVEQYYVLRFIAGVGLAGELGIGITLVAEVMTKETRGYGTTLVSGVGIAGAIAGFLVADIFDWRMAYFVGGGLGLVLLLMRVSVYESGLFTNIKTSSVSKGQFSKLFTDKKRFFKYLKCILIGVPVWYVIGIIVTLAPEFASAKGLNVSGDINGGRAIMYHYIGASLGAFLTGILSQLIKSRKKALLMSLTGLTITLSWLFLSQGVSPFMFYLLLFIVGIPNGYWAVFVTNASEQFGTNLRATVTTSVPNFVRGTTVIVTNAFFFLRNNDFTLIAAATIVGIVVMTFAFYATYTSEESYHKDLDYLENV